MAPHAEAPISHAAYAQSVKDAQFLDALENYIALGCLHLRGKCNVDYLGSNPTPERIKKFTSSVDFVYQKQGSANPVVTPALGAFTKLLEHGWIRVSCPPGLDPSCTDMIRVHLLPHDVGRRLVRRDSKDLQSALQSLLHVIDISASTWNGSLESASAKTEYIYFDPWATGEDCSLFYLFNTLPSPCPDPDTIANRHARYAAKQLLGEARLIKGLKTALYPYQTRSAALMLERESSVQLQLDPRLELRTAVDGRNYYYDARQGLFFRNPRYYDSNRGGILAETMGLGKTIICLAVILATKHHLPKIPQQYALLLEPKRRETTASLASMAAASLQRASVPARWYFDGVAETGREMTECLRALDDEPAEYLIPGQPLRIRRQVGNAPARRMRLCSGTIIVVPRNLVSSRIATSLDLANRN